LYSFGVVVLAATPIPQHSRGIVVTTTKTTTTAQLKSTTTSQSKVTSVGKDWRKLGGVTPVKDQEVRECSSCWAHAVVGSIESQYLIKKK
jgi:C1A family cysteine protease